MNFSWLLYLQQSLQGLQQPNQHSHGVYNVTVKDVEGRIEAEDEETIEPTSPIQVVQEVGQADSSKKIQDKFHGSSDDESSNLLPVQKNHPISSIIGNPLDGKRTRDKPILNYRDMVNHSCFISSVEPNVRNVTH